MRKHTVLGHPHRDFFGALVRAPSLGRRCALVANFAGALRRRPDLHHSSYRTSEDTLSSHDVRVLLQAARTWWGGVQRRP